MRRPWTAPLVVAMLAGSSARASTPRLDIALSPEMELRIAAREAADDVYLDGRALPAKVAADTRPIAIAFVVCATSVWLGRDKLPPIPEGIGDSREPGALEELQDAFNKHVRHGWPAGSKAVLLTYGNEVAIADPRGPILRKVLPLGHQAQYEHENGAALMLGIEVGIDQVTADNFARRAIIVLGEGLDDHVAQLSAEHVRARLAASGAELHSIVLPSWLTLVYPREEDILGVTPDSVHVKTPRELGGALRDVLVDLRQRYEIVVAADALPRDGGFHVLELKHGARTVASTLLWLPGATG